MIEEYLKPYTDKFVLDPFSKICIHNISEQPNVYTALAGVLGVLSAFSIYYHFIYFGAVLLVLSGFFDAFDGYIARATGNDSSIGAVFDILCDRVVEFSIIFALFSLDPLTRAIPSIFILGSILCCVTSFLVVGIFAQNNSSKGFHYSPGLVERPEAFIFFLAMLLIPSMYLYLALTFTALVVLTTCIRVWEFVKEEKCC